MNDEHLSEKPRGLHYSRSRALLERVCRRVWGNGWGARLWARYPGALRAVKVEREFDFGRARPALKLAFLSDLHVGPTTPQELLVRAVESINEFAPDLVLLGGDYVFLEADSAKLSALQRLLSAIDAPLKIGVFGNHDLWTDHQGIARALSAAGVEVCVNRAIALPAPHDDVVVFGLDDPWTGAPDAQGAQASCEAFAVRLALAHSPDGIRFLGTDGFDLLFCGHTHGGQIALPFGIPIMLPPGPYSKRLASGFHQVGKLRVFVSRGLGATDLPVRAFAPPDVALFTLR